MNVCCLFVSFGHWELNIKWVVLGQKIIVKNSVFITQSFFICKLYLITEYQYIDNIVAFI